MAKGTTASFDMGRCEVWRKVRQNHEEVSKTFDVEARTIRDWHYKAIDDLLLEQIDTMSGDIQARNKELDARGDRDSANKVLGDYMKELHSTFVEDMNEVQLRESKRLQTCMSEGEQVVASITLRREDYVKRGRELLAKITSHWAEHRKWPGGSDSED